MIRCKIVPCNENTYVVGTNWDFVPLTELLAIILSHKLPQLFMYQLNNNVGINEVKKKAKIGNQYNPVPLLTQDTTWESDKNTSKHDIQESKELCPLPVADHKAAMNRQNSMTDTKHK